MIMILFSEENNIISTNVAVQKLKGERWRQKTLLNTTHKRKLPKRSTVNISFCWLALHMLLVAISQN